MGQTRNQAIKGTPQDSNRSGQETARQMTTDRAETDRNFAPVTEHGVATDYDRPDSQVFSHRGVIQEEHVGDDGDKNEFKAVRRDLER